MSVGFRLWVLFFGFSVWLWLIVGIFGLGLLGFCLSFLYWVTYVYFLVYLEVHCAFFDIYIITYKKKKSFIIFMNTVREESKCYFYFPHP